MKNNKPLTIFIIIFVCFFVGTLAFGGNIFMALINGLMMSVLGIVGRAILSLFKKKTHTLKKEKQPVMVKMAKPIETDGEEAEKVEEVEQKEPTLVSLSHQEEDDYDDFEETKVCPECKSTIPKSATRCKHCGTQLNKWSKTAGCLIAVVFIIFLISLIANLTDSDSSTPQQVDLVKLKTEAQEINYDDMARYPENYLGKPVVLTGEITQKMDNTLRVSVTKGEYGLWTDVVYIKLLDKETRLLEKDIVKMWGIADGNEDYIAVLGSKIIIPRVNVYLAEVVTKQDENR